MIESSGMSEANKPPSLGQPPDWSRLCGLVTAGNKAYFYVLAGSFGNRFMNRSAELTYFDVKRDARLVSSIMSAATTSRTEMEVLRIVLPSKRSRRLFACMPALS